MTPSGGVRPVNGERAALDILDSDDTSTFTNTGAAGINRLIAFGDLLLIDNIGRNFELRQVRNATGPAWAQRAIYDVTIFPGEDNPSILDSDVHGAFLASGDRWLLVGNHFGRVRCFRWPLSGDSMPCRPVPDVELQLPGDTERLAFDGNCFITSSPRGAYTPDPARPGLFVSEPVPPFLAEPATDVPHRLAGRWELSDWDVVTALALEAHTGMLAVAASARLALFDLDRDHDGTRLGRPRWETRLMQPARWIGFDRKGHLLVGSHEGRDDDGTGWNACTGGTLAVRTIDGSVGGRVDRVCRRSRRRAARGGPCDRRDPASVRWCRIPDEGIARYWPRAPHRQAPLCGVQPRRISRVSIRGRVAGRCDEPRRRGGAEKPICGNSASRRLRGPYRWIR
jgi:hypothetical protein